MFVVGLGFGRGCAVFGLISFWGLLWAIGFLCGCGVWVCCCCIYWNC